VGRYLALYSVLTESFFCSENNKYQSFILFFEILFFSPKVNKTCCFWNFVGFYRRWALSFPGELLPLGQEKNEQNRGI
jgi:hypothetical protein